MPERANFSATEYQYLKDRWGSQSSRLGGDSMRNFNQCALCLNSAVSPMTCKEGHLFCKECILTNLLKQKADIRDHQVALDALVLEQEKEKTLARERAREKVLKDFERGYGFGGSDSAAGSSASAGTKRKAPAEADSSAPDSASSSVASLPERARKVAEEAEERALAAIEEEHRLSTRKKLPAFWLPSLTPSEKEGQVDLKRLRTSLEPLCRVGNEHGHPISIKSLVPVTFTESPSSTDSKKKAIIICPSCKKAISNSHRLFTVRKCSHTFCNHCADQLIFNPAKVIAKEQQSTKSKEVLATCPECPEGIVKNIEKDVIQLHREGTGFAAAGGASGKKKGIAFQG
ncbi:unnamed protein product [Sympodiomycopsis kandeliae]